MGCDDGSAEDEMILTPPNHLLVTFWLPSGWSTARVLSIETWIFSAPQLSYKVLIIEGATEVFSQTRTAGGTGWDQISGVNVQVDVNFAVAIEFLNNGGPGIGLDQSGQGCSSYENPTGDYHFLEDANVMIHVQVEQFQQQPVGGVVMPTNTLAILGPWLAVIGLVGGIGAVAVVAQKRRRDQC
jgi:hypothetical protein